jgi:hypothetical protein
VLVYDPADMKGWRLPAAIAVIVALSVVGIRHALEQRSQQKHEQQKRELIYQSDDSLTVPRAPPLMNRAAIVRF